MSEIKSIVIGSRGSALALWQSNFVKKEIESKYPEIEVEIKLIQTKGDSITDIALSKIGDKGLFTKELESELSAGNIDIAVHSLKDMPTTLPKGMKISAITSRYDVEDVLIAREKGVTIHSLKQGAVVATGSLRRMSQLLSIRPDIKIVDLRGNVPTRIKKFLASDWDAIILARAGVERLQMSKYISSHIPLEEMLPAPGQGALAVEIQKSNKFAADITSFLNDEDTSAAVNAERSFLKTLEGGCHVPIGAYAEIRPNGLYLEGFVGSVDGKTVIRKKLRGSKADPGKLGKSLAKDILDNGGKELLEEFKKSESE